MAFLWERKYRVDPKNFLPFLTNFTLYNSIARKYREDSDLSINAGNLSKRYVQGQPFPSSKMTQNSLLAKSKM